MPYPTFSAAGSLVSAAAASSISTSYPSGVDDDIVVCQGMNKYGKSFATPSGWTLITSSGTYAWFWKRVTASIGSCGLSASGGSGFIMGCCYRFANCRRVGTPYDSLGSSSGAAFSVTIGAVVTDDTERLCAHFAMLENDSGSNDDATNYAEADEQQTTVGTDGQVDLYTYNRPTAGTVPSTSYSIGSITTYKALVLSLAPARYENKVLGVETKNIGKVFGVATRDVSKVNGV